MRSFLSSVSEYSERSVEVVVLLLLSLDDVELTDLADELLPDAVGSVPDGFDPDGFAPDSLLPVDAFSVTVPSEFLEELSLSLSSEDDPED